MNDMFNESELQEEQDILDSELAHQQSMDEQSDLLTKDEQREYIFVQAARAMANVACPEFLTFLSKHDRPLFDKFFGGNIAPLERATEEDVSRYD